MFPSISALISKSGMGRGRGLVSVVSSIISGRLGKAGLSSESQQAGMIKKKKNLLLESPAFWLARNEVLAQHQYSLILCDSIGVSFFFSGHKGEKPRRLVLEESCPVLLFTLLHPVPIESEGTVVN